MITSHTAAKALQGLHLRDMKFTENTPIAANQVKTEDGRCFLRFLWPDGTIGWARRITNGGMVVRDEAVETEQHEELEAAYRTLTKRPDLPIVSMFLP